MNGEADHIIFEAGPKVQILDLVRVIKTKTSRFVRKHYGKDLEKVLPEACFLERQLFCCNSRECSQGHGGTVYPETGTEQK